MNVLLFLLAFLGSVATVAGIGIASEREGPPVFQPYALAPVRPVPPTPPPVSLEDRRARILRAIAPGEQKVR